MTLVEASLVKLAPFDTTHDYTPDEFEPYDALGGRFVRAVEIFLKFFRSYERLLFGAESETLRDQLNRMAKLGVISSVGMWFDIRDIRNRIVHDYLPDKVKNIYDAMQGEFSDELKRALAVVNALELSDDR
jgi:hypothetical protein